MRATLHKVVRQSLQHSNLPLQKINISSTAGKHVHYMQTNIALQTGMQPYAWVLFGYRHKQLHEYFRIFSQVGWFW